MCVHISEIEAGYLPDVNILNGISLSVPAGNIVTIIGPNGSGKSTVLKTLMGYLPARRGTLEIDGQRINGVPVHRRVRGHALAYVPQRENVFGPLTVRENLEVGGRSLPPTERKARIAELLDMYPNLREKAGARADSLSGGERQMLALARALMTRPRYLLLDEPSAGLSPRMTDELFAVVQDICRRQGVTILLVEQNAVQALRLSDYGYVLVAGRVALKGPAQEILADPKVKDLYLGGIDREVAE